MENDGLIETKNSICGSHIDPENDENLSETKSDDENLNETNSGDEDLSKTNPAEDLAYNTSASPSSSHSDAPQINGVPPEIADLEEQLINTNEENEALEAALYCGKITAENMERLIESLEYEKSVLLAENQNLNLKLDTDAELNRKLEAIIETAATGAKLLEENNLVLHDRLLQMETKFKDEKDKHDKLQEIYDNNMNTSSCKIEELKIQAKILQLKVNSLTIQKGELEKKNLKESKASTSLEAQKNRLEMQIETQKQESSERLAQAENQKIILESNIESLRRKLDEQKESFDKLTQQHKENEASSTIKLNEQIHKLKEDVDNVKGKLKYKEKTMQENKQKSDAKIQLLNKKFQEERKLLAERENSYQISKQWEFCRSLGSRIAGLDKAVDKSFENFDNIITDLAKIAYDTNDIKGMEDSVSRISRESQIAKNLVTKLNRDKAKLELDLKEKADNFELKATRDEAEKEQMRKEMNELKEKIVFLEENVAKFINTLARRVDRYEELLKEKEDRASRLGEEKRESIRQLCLSIEYHRDQCDDLKAALSTVTNHRYSFCCLH